MIRFADVTDTTCRTPVSGDPGPEMQVCGEPALPGRSCCAECRSRLYTGPVTLNLKTLTAPPWGGKLKRGQ